MRLKRLLIVLPLLFIIFLLQAYFWVPTYHQQTAGNPKRLTKFIMASGGDAKILNPILNSDSVSSTVTALMFDGLLELDEDLQLAGNLAAHWRISEQAYLTVNPLATLPDQSTASAESLERIIRAALQAGELPAVGANLESIRRLPAETVKRAVSVRTSAPDAEPEFMEIPLRVTLPARLVFSLKEVDQDFFTRLRPVLGDDYAAGFPYDRHIIPEGELTPELSGRLQDLYPTVISIEEHNPEILFHLRKNVRFHDGHPFDAGDVKFTYDAIMDPKNISPRTSDFEPIKHIEVVDAHTVKVVYKRLYSPAINAWSMGILPEHLLNDDVLGREMHAAGLSEEARAVFGMRDSMFNLNPVGTGLFKFAEWRSGELITLRRNDDYWDAPAEYEKFNLRIIPDLLTQEMEFRTGAIDYYVAQPHQVARYKSDDNYQYSSSLSFSYSYIGYNHRKPLFRDPRIRRALGLAINVDEIIEYLLYNEGERVTGPYAKITQWYDQDLPPLPYDPQRAEALFNAAGWHRNQDGWMEKDGKIFEFTLITNSGNPLRKNVMTIAQNAWRKIGVKCTTQFFEWAVFLKDFINTAEFDATVLGWSTGIDPDQYQIWHSSQAGPQQLNFIGYDNPQADDLILRIRREYDVGRQRELAHALHQLIYADQPYTFLYTSKGTRLLDKKIVLVDRAGDGSESYRQLHATRDGGFWVYFDKMRKLAFNPAF